MVVKKRGVSGFQPEIATAQNIELTLKLGEMMQTMNPQYWENNELS